MVEYNTVTVCKTDILDADGTGHDTRTPLTDYSLETIVTDQVQDVYNTSRFDWLILAYTIVNTPHPQAQARTEQ